VAHTDAVVVLTTLASTDDAVKLIKALLERRLVACGTVTPGARSLYRWEDKLADEQEVMVMLKTRSGAVHGLERAFKELHPYKVPELLVVPVSGGLERYLGWINSETSLTIV
jgi:periplasmic divalent cation tolerance protein